MKYFQNYFRQNKFSFRCSWGPPITAPDRWGLATELRVYGPLNSSFRKEDGRAVLERGGEREWGGGPHILTPDSLSLYTTKPLLLLLSS
jgi:hypothetical protein